MMHTTATEETTDLLRRNLAGQPRFSRWRAMRNLLVVFLIWAALWMLVGMLAYGTYFLIVSGIRAIGSGGREATAQQQHSIPPQMCRYRQGEIALPMGAEPPRGGWSTGFPDASPGIRGSNPNV